MMYWSDSDIRKLLVRDGLIVRKRNRVLLESAMDTLKAERPMTLRQLYYRLVSAGVLENAQPEYARLGGLMTRAREHGTIARTWIVDHVRSTLKPSSWSGLADFGESVRACYRRDFWAGLPHYVCIFCEKDAIAGTLQPVTESYDVPLHVCRGYSSVSFAGEIADGWREIEKPVFGYYVGDHDPSGFDIERDLRGKLARYSGRAEGDPDCKQALCNEIPGHVFFWERLAVQEDDFDAFDLIELPVKHKDKRAASFIRERGRRCAEVDALPPSELRRRVEQAILHHVDDVQWAKLQEHEKAEQAVLEKLVSKWEKRNRS